MLLTSCSKNHIAFNYFNDPFEQLLCFNSKTFFRLSLISILHRKGLNLNKKLWRTYQNSKLVPLVLGWKRRNIHPCLKCSFSKSIIFGCIENLGFNQLNFDKPMFVTKLDSETKPPRGNCKSRLKMTFLLCPFTILLNFKGF